MADKPAAHKVIEHQTTEITLEGVDYYLECTYGINGELGFFTDDGNLTVRIPFSTFEELEDFIGYLIAVHCTEVQRAQEAKKDER